MLERYHAAPQHGLTVGVGTLMVYPAFKKFAEADISKIDVDSLVPMPYEDRRKWVLGAYGEMTGGTIIEENPNDFLTEAELRRRARRAIERKTEIDAVISDMPSFERIEAAMRELGAPMTMKELGVDDDITNMSMHCAKDYRARYTLFKTLDELGILNDYIKDYPIEV